MWAPASIQRQSATTKTGRPDANVRRARQEPTAKSAPNLIGATPALDAEVNKSKSAFFLFYNMILLPEAGETLAFFTSIVRTWAPT